MTSGSIRRKILAFAMPLFLGNLFQQLYKAADSLIVGRFVFRYRIPGGVQNLIMSLSNVVYPITWTLSSATFLLFYRKYRKQL